MLLLSNRHCANEVFHAVRSSAFDTSRDNEIDVHHIPMMYTHGTGAADLRHAKSCRPQLFGTSEPNCKFREGNERDCGCGLTRFGWEKEYERGGSSRYSGLCWCKCLPGDGRISAASRVRERDMNAAVSEGVAGVRCERVGASYGPYIVTFSGPDFNIISCLLSSSPSAGILLLCSSPMTTMINTFYRGQPTNCRGRTVPSTDF